MVCLLISRNRIEKQIEMFNNPGSKHGINQMIIFKHLIIIFFLPWSLRAQENWSLEKDKDDIRVFSKQPEHSKFKEVKVECVIYGTISELIAVIFDIENHVHWVYNTKSAHIIKRISDSELYFYTEISTPWPFRNRDAIAHIKTFRDSLTNKIWVESNSVPDYIPQKEELVRIPRSKVIWTISSLDKHAVEVTYYMEADPGGSIPPWLINMFVSKGPFESFTKLKERIKLPQYK